MKKFFLCLALGAAAGALIFAGGSKEQASPGAAAEKSYEFKLGHLAPTNDPRHQALEMFSKAVVDGSKGRIKITVYPSSTLGSERELFEQVKGGVTEFALIGSVVGNFVPEYAIMDLPYLWKSQDHLRRVISGPIGKEWENKMKQQFNVALLGFFDRNPRILTNTKRPVRTISDLSGMKVRVPEIKMHMDTWRAFGVQPTPMPASEFYMGLKMGVIDAMENPVEVMYTWKIYEVAKYLSLTEHIRSALYFIYSSQKISALPPNDLRIITEAARTAEDWHNKEVASQASGLFDKLKEQGMIINEVDKSGFIEASQKIHQEYLKVIGEETYKKIVSMD